MPHAHFRGELTFKWLDDGRLMQLLSEFAFIDAGGTEWVVPGTAVIDGASIPRVLWAIVGGPYEGKYRKASVVHDWYCDVRTREWQAVHRMFHEAMLVSGVDATQARVLYLAVRYGGPRWSNTAIANSQLASGEKWSAAAPGSMATPDLGPVASDEGPATPGQVIWRRAIADTAPFEAMAARVAAEDLSIDEIDRLADAQSADIVTKAVPLRR